MQDMGRLAETAGESPRDPHRSGTSWKDAQSALLKHPPGAPIVRGRSVTASDALPHDVFDLAQGLVDA